MFQIRARARAPLFGVPARALVRTSLGGSTSAFVCRHHPHFQSIHHGDPIALRKGLIKRLLFQLSIDASCSFPRGNRVYACPQSSGRLLGSVRVYRIQAIRVNKQQRAKTTLAVKRCSKTIPMRDLHHILGTKKIIRGPTHSSKSNSILGSTLIIE